jgi:DNA-binding transcriptional regulator GbsR (MarR family)
MQLTDQAKSTYFELYLLAGKSDAFGLVLAGDVTATVQDLAWILRKSDADMQNALDELQRAELVDLDGGVTVTKFACEQGPTMAEKRRQWALRQAKRRALAKGETWIEPDADESNADEHEKQNKKQEKQTEQDIKTQTKRVTQTSRESHAGVTRDNSGGGDLIDSGLVLSVWHDMTGLEFKPGKAFDAMIKDWQSAGVTVQNVRDAITQANGTANTPLYVAIPAKNLHTKETAQAQSSDVALERFRKLYREQKQTGGDNGIHE